MMSFFSHFPWPVLHFDVGRGLVALGLSILLFGAVEREQNPPETASYDLRVDLQGLPAGLVALNDSSTSRTVTVRISGPRDNLANVRSDSVQATVDLSKATPGQDQYPVMVEVPDPKLRIVDVSPSRIAVRVDQTVDRQVSVKLTRTGSVPLGYEAGDAEIDPTTVTVSGPSTIVRTVDSANVEFKLDGVTAAVDARVAAVPVDAQGQPVTVDGPPLRVNPATVRVRIPVDQQLSYKTVGVQPTIVGAVQSGYVIEGVTTEPSAMTIVGSPQALTSVNFASTEQVDVTDANATFAKQVSVIVPEGVSVVGDGTVRVTVRVSALSLTQSFSAVPTADNLTPGLQVVSALPNLQIVLQGPPSALRGVQASDLKVSLNLAGLGAGPHQVNVDVTPPAGLTLQSVNPAVLTVTLAEIQATPGPTPRPATPTRRPTPQPATLTPTEETPPTPTLTLSPIPPTVTPSRTVRPASLP